MAGLRTLLPDRLLVPRPALCALPQQRKAAKPENGQLLRMRNVKLLAPKAKDELLLSAHRKFEKVYTGLL